MASDISNILYLFRRPAEPVYVPKGKKKVAFDIPLDYLPERLQPQQATLYHEIGDKIEYKIPLNKITLPDLEYCKQLSLREPFSVFNPKHQKIAGQLIDIFMGTETYEDFLSTAAYCRGHVNMELFVYALSVAILHHSATKTLSVPPLYQIFPSKFVNDKLLTEIRESVNLLPAASVVHEGTAFDITQDYTASDLEIEHRLAYWREDIGYTMHHWHWHLVYPFAPGSTFVGKDRRGELFYYMHEQIMARYNCERLCNQLRRVQNFVNWREPIIEGYFPKLLQFTSGRTWPSRPTNSFLQDISRPDDGYEFTIKDLERWHNRVLDAIHTGSVINTNGEEIPLTEKDGIDILGNIVEASILSPNPDFYGNLHNRGHVVISFCHDPDKRHMEDIGVMGDNSTSSRDPIFYRWHGFINDLFLEHKHSLPPYDVSQLDYPDIKVEQVTLETNQEPNVINTFWTKSEVDLEPGLDWSPNNKTVRVNFTHLNHTEFIYKIAVKNNTTETKLGTIRIFIAPAEDERGLPITFVKQKSLMIEMDKFFVKLEPGERIIQQKSTDSSVTIPFEQTFPPRDEDTTKCLKPDRYCGCGWPQHLLVPKGAKGGFPMDLFVMVSDYTKDVVEQDRSTCWKDGVSYCGLKNKKYPDARAMGYPFDRLPRKKVNQLSEFLTPNMKTERILVKYTNAFKPPSNNNDVPDSNCNRDHDNHDKCNRDHENHDKCNRDHCKRDRY